MTFEEIAGKIRETGIKIADGDDQILFLIQDMINLVDHFADEEYNNGIEVWLNSRRVTPDQEWPHDAVVFRLTTYRGDDEIMFKVFMKARKPNGN